MKAKTRPKHLRAARRALKAGRLVEAFEQTLQIAKKRVRDADVQAEAGGLCLSLGQPGAARECFMRALQQRPHDPGPLVGLGRAYLAEGDIANAAGVGETVTKRAPDNGPGHALRALVLREMWRLEEAHAAAGRAVDLSPKDADVQLARGNVALRLGRLDEAADAFDAASRIRPESALGWMGLGHTRAREGHSDEAREAFEKALEIDPEDTVAHWAHARAVRPVHADEDSVAREWARVQPEMSALAEGVKLRSPAQIARAEAAIMDNFHLHYLGADPLALQRQHGALVHRIMGARFPAYARRRPMPPVEGRVRIGFVSSHFRAHTIRRLFKGWITGLDPHRFEVFVYHFHPIFDAGSEALRARVEHYVIEASDLAKMAKRITSDRLHALVYPEVGMDRQIVKLAALYLAPFQCTTFGHPVTSGLPSLDGMLSSELVETPEADEHYTERLVRLPGTGLHLAPPEPESAGATRATLELPEDRCLYLSCQSLFKYLPRYDDVFARIAEQVPSAHFAFIGHPQETVTRVFRERLDRAFAARGLEGADRITILPRLGGAAYVDLNRCSDVFLDSIDWSAGRSALDAIACGLPVVTLPGEFARGRFTQAYLRQIGVDETIADSVEGYVEIAAALGNEPERREALRARIEQTRGKLYGDASVIAALEAFLVEAIESARPDPARAEPGSPRVSDADSPRPRRARGSGAEPSRAPAPPPSRR